jgi:hypothetical protein
MPMPDTTTRSALLSSWEAARRQADHDGAIKLNAASFAGFVLVQAGGLVPLAIELVPVADGSLFYARVIACLQSVEAEERAPVVAPPTESTVRAC